MMGALLWALLEAADLRRFPWRGLALGAVCGMVAISPAIGIVAPANVTISLAATGAAFFVARTMRSPSGAPGATQVTAIHGIGAAVGVVLTGFFADPAVNSNLIRLAPPNGSVLGHPLALFQLGAVLVVLVVATVGTTAIAWTLKALSRPRAQG